MDMAIERRKFERVPAKLRIRYRTEQNASPDAQLATSGDVGEGGMCLEVQEPLAPGQEIRLSIANSEGIWSTEVIGIVAWHVGGYAESAGRLAQQIAGISFPSPDEKSRNGIRSWLSEYVGALPRSIGLAYDGSTVTYRVLRAFGWGQLNNLGYFAFPSPFSVLNLLASLLFFKTPFLLPEAQDRLVRKSTPLLDVRNGDSILDVACGRGRGSFIIASLNPHAHVTAIDLLPTNIHVASTLYEGTKNLGFRVDDAMKLSFSALSFEKVICLEAAFHFPDRARFLAEAYRVLKPGGKALIVDFMWKTEKDRAILSDDATYLVRNIWQWDDFSTIDEYITDAQATGFKISACHDWSRKVTDPVAFSFKAIAELGRNHWTRLLLVKANPLLASLTDADWNGFAESAYAHDHVKGHMEYRALVLSK